MKFSAQKTNLKKSWLGIYFWKKKLICNNQLVSVIMQWIVLHLEYASFFQKYDLKIIVREGLG